MKQTMQGYLYKTEKKWIVVYQKYSQEEGYIKLYAYDIQFENDKKTIFQSFYNRKSVEFEIVKLINDEDGKEGLYAKLIDKSINTEEIYINYINTLSESVYCKGVKEDYEEGFVDGYNKAKENLYTEEQMLECWNTLIIDVTTFKTFIELLKHPKKNI